VFGWTLDEHGSFEVLDAYRRTGGNFIDTADTYGRRGSDGPGSSERIVGRWLAARGNREEMVVATKVGMSAELPGLSADNVRRACDASLERLGIERIDLYYAHQDDPHVPLAETLSAFDELIRAGKVRYVAASNYAPARLREALAVARDEELSSFVALQPHYNLLERGEYEGELESLCERHGLACLPYFALARGFLTGKYGRQDAAGTPDSQRAEGTHGSPRAEGVLDSYGNERGFATLDALREVAGELDAPMAAVALAWLLSKPTVAAPIASATSPAQLAESMRAAELTLGEQQLERLDRASTVSSP
jgi:aryl-alcohol dehydrogenase-like predicted oxidoreductase